jgi:hypothetical protein
VTRAPRIDMTRNELVAIGARRRRAKGNFEKVNEEAKQAARAAVAAGMTEVDVKDALGVDRMTVRSWLGKR